MKPLLNALRLGAGLLLTACLLPAHAQPVWEVPLDGKTLSLIGALPVGGPDASLSPAARRATASADVLVLEFTTDAVIAQTEPWGPPANPGVPPQLLEECATAEPDLDLGRESWDMQAQYATCTQMAWTASGLVAGKGTRALVLTHYGAPGRRPIVGLASYVDWLNAMQRVPVVDMARFYRANMPTRAYVDAELRRLREAVDTTDDTALTALLDDDQYGPEATPSITTATIEEWNALLFERLQARLRQMPAWQGHMTVVLSPEHLLGRTGLLTRFAEQGRRARRIGD